MTLPSKGVSDIGMAVGYKLAFLACLISAILAVWRLINLIALISAGARYLILRCSRLL